LLWIKREVSAELLSPGVEGGAAADEAVVQIEQRPRRGGAVGGDLLAAR